MPSNSKSNQAVARRDGSSLVRAKKVVGSMLAADGTARKALSSDEEAALLYSAFIGACNRNPLILECVAQAEDTVAAALTTCAALKLYPGPMNQVALVPRRNSKMKNRRELHAEPMVAGIIDLAYRNPLVAAVEAELVFQGEEFWAEKGTTARIHHRLDPSKRKRVKTLADAKKHVAAVYCVVTTTRGGKHFRVMNLDEVEDIRAKAAASQKGSKSPWDTDWQEMALKTVVKATCKKAPKSRELSLGMAVDDQIQLGRPDVAAAIVTEAVEVEEPSAAPPVDIDPNTGEVIGYDDPPPSQADEVKDDLQEPDGSGA